MKTSMINNIKSSWVRGVGLLASLAMLSLLATACGKGGDSPAAVPYGPGIVPIGVPGVGGVPVCQGCPGAPRLITSVLARGYSGYGAPVEMALDIYGDQNSAMQSAMTIGTYYGPFAATGYLFVQTALQECGLPGGRFALQTVSPGVWGNDGAGRSGENLMMVLAGAPIPVNVFLSGFTMPATPAVQGSDGRMYPYSFTTTTLQVKRADASVICTLFLQ